MLSSHKKCFILALKLMKLLDGARQTCNFCCCCINNICMHKFYNISDQPSSSNIDVDDIPKVEAHIATQIETHCSHKSVTSQINEEYTDSLEFDAVNKGSNRNNDNNTEGELFDMVEQDSLETTKIESNKANNGENTQFLPFAHIGTCWSNGRAASQLNIQPINSSNTNQTVENTTTNQTNAFADQTNNSINTKQSIEFDFQDIPGILKCCKQTTKQKTIKILLTLSTNTLA